MKTLIVEDDYPSRFFLQNFLSRYGECDIAVNGKEALDAFRKAGDNGEPYNLICMDIMMPEMDGQEAVTQVRALEKASGIFPPHSVRIIMTTAVDDMKEVIRSFYELCDAYLTKPIDTDEMVRHLRSF